MRADRKYFFSEYQRGSLGKEIGREKNKVVKDQEGGSIKREFSSVPEWYEWLLRPSQREPILFVDIVRMELDVSSFHDDTVHVSGFLG
jgi:hypothetical protein